ncbi:Ankyrin-3 [Lachnellula arida]|uniref:Ankyrin-3 n=1 Tax=Lachnellula arida TaxID=1316785 RepID=A0A8T9BIB5_9HELO|nr:Ankyrin-3 [Lachnellula arida]
MTSDLHSDDSDFELVDSLDVAKQIAAEKQPDLTQIKAWLNPTDYAAFSSEFHRHLSSRAPETGEWIRETPQFSLWDSSTDHGSIWIKAVPGAGKSVVAASMVDSLSRNETVPVMYFFFRQIIETNRSSRSLLRDWLAQLLPFSEILQVSLWEFVEEEKDLESLSTSQLWNYLLAGLRSVEKAYCVVDALDEMSIDEDFLSRLNSLGSFRPAEIKILMTSRPKQYLQRSLKDPQVIHVSLEEELVTRDISLFVRQRTAEFSRDGINPETRKFIRDTVCKRSDGLFLYARLMLDQIANAIKEKEDGEDTILEVVAKLPVGLEEMYNRILFDHALSTQVGQNIQILILQLVTHSARPMRLIEIAKAIEANHRIAATDRDSKEIVRSACGPLLDIMEDEVVQILHHSFTEFLLDSSRIQRSTPGAPQFPVIEPATAHRSIALACLARLQRDTFTAYPEEDDPKLREDSLWGRYQRPGAKFDFQGTFLRHAFAEYAAKKWIYHAKNYDKEDRSFFNSLEGFCDSRSSHFRAWLELMAGETNSAVARQGSTQLHVAAGFGLSSWAQYLILSGAGVNVADSSENTPLLWAAKGGHSEVVRLLLEAGAKPDVDGYDGLKPLHVAASRNHAQVVKLILAADIGRHCGNAPSSVGATPLMYASQSGHVESVLQMIPYAKKEDLEDALCRAAVSGHFQLMSALLEESKISPDATSAARSSGRNSCEGPAPALVLAAQSLEPECVRLLLEKGASVKQEPPKKVQVSRFFPGSRPEGRTAIHSLAQANTRDSKNVSNLRHILEMLLSAGADLEAKDGGGNTPLLLTVGPGSEAYTALEPLLSLGADPSATDSNGETLLHRACRAMASTEVASQLLSHKALSAQARSSDGVTPLHLAVENIHSPVDHIQFLVDHGADINAQDSNGNTPLHNTCRGHSMKKQQILSALLRLGASVDAQDSLGQTPMHEFKMNGGKDSDQACILIDTGANLEISDRYGMTVLLHAVAKSNRALVEMLLQHPKTPSLEARTFLKGKTVLHLACQTQSPVELVRLLVGKGADPKLTDNDGNTLLHQVAERFGGSPEEITLVEYLIKVGVSPHARNCQRQTAAHIISPVYVEDNISRTTPTRESFVSVLLRLDPNVDINAQDIDGYTPLHFASAVSETAAFNLIRNNANLNAKSFGLRTPLHCAARGRQSSIIAMLVQFGKKSDSPIDVSAADIEGRSPLHDACRSGIPESVSILISAGADINLAAKDRLTPLKACAESIEEDNIWSLMRKQSTVQKLTSSLSLQDPFRRLPIFDSRFFGGRSQQDHAARVDVIAKMLMKANANIDGALSFALSCKNTELVTAIRQQGKEDPLQKTNSAETVLTVQVPNPTAVIDNGHTPPDRPIASIEGIDEAAMEDLLSQNVDFTKANRNDDDGTAIAKIARLGRTDLMAKIITKAKLLDDPTFAQNLAETVHAGYTRIRPLLQVACDRSAWNMEMVKLLLTEGIIDVNAHQLVKKAKKPGEAEGVVMGSTALHVLAKGHFWWQVDAIEYLINNGAQVDALDANGQTPLQVASSHTKYCSATRKGFFKPQCSEMLLRLGADPNRTDDEGLTPLNKAGSDTDIIRIILKYGADVSAGRKGVLASAIESGNIQVLKVYLEHGADCNILDTSKLSLRNIEYDRSRGIQNRYPLTIAALQPASGSWSSSAAKEMVKLLLDYGAKVDVPVNDAEPLLHFMFQRATSSVLRPFLENPNLDLNMRDSQGRTVFMAACSSTVDSEARLGSLLPRSEKARLKTEYIPAYMLLADSQRYGSTIDYLATDNKGRHLIFYLLEKRNDKVLDRFLPIPGVKALVRQKNNEGFSPLHLAFQSGMISLCLKLINEGADLLEPDPNGNTVLHHLARTVFPRNEERLSLMNHALALGADINARNNLGQSPLLSHIAAGYNTGDSCFFVANGADVQAAMNDGTTALHMVARRGNRALGNFRRDDVDHNIVAFRRLVQLGCDPLREDGEGRTALDIAASVGNDGILGLYQRKKGLYQRKKGLYQRKKGL